MSTVIYRVENDKGDGPYTGNAYWSFGPDDTRDFKRWPSPESDYRWLSDLYAASYAAGRAAVQALRFGFPTREAADKWFGPYALAELAKLGFTLRAYKVEIALVSDSGRQAMFDRSRATLIHEGVEPKPRPPPYLAEYPSFIPTRTVRDTP